MNRSMYLVNNEYIAENKIRLQVQLLKRINEAREKDTNFIYVSFLIILYSNLFEEDLLYIIFQNPIR